MRKHTVQFWLEREAQLPEDITGRVLETGKLNEVIERQTAEFEGADLELTLDDADGAVSQWVHTTPASTAWWLSVFIDGNLTFSGRVDVESVRLDPWQRTASAKFVRAGFDVLRSTRSPMGTSEEYLRIDGILNAIAFSLPGQLRVLSSSGPSVDGTVVPWSHLWIRGDVLSAGEDDNGVTVAHDGAWLLRELVRTFGLVCFETGQDIEVQDRPQGPGGRLVQLEESDLFDASFDMSYGHTGVKLHGPRLPEYRELTTKELSFVYGAESGDVLDVESQILAYLYVRRGGIYTNVAQEVGTWAVRQYKATTSHAKRQLKASLMRLDVGINDMLQIAGIRGYWWVVETWRDMFNQTTEFRAVRI